MTQETQEPELEEQDDETWDEAEPEEEARRTTASLKALGKRLADVPNLELAWGQFREVLRVGFPNGRERRWVVFSDRQVRNVDDLPIEEMSFLGDYQAIWNRESGDIEARLTAITAGRIWRQVGDLEVETSDGWVEVPIDSGAAPLQ